MAWLDAAAELPALSAAVTVMGLSPGTRVTRQLNVPPLSVAAAPLQVTVATPESASLTVPLTVMLAFVPELWFGGAVMVTAGAVVSSAICTWAGVVLPVPSVATAVSVLGPSAPVSVTVVVQAPFANGTSTFSTVTFATATSSLAVPLTVMLAFLVNVPATGVVMVMTGA